MENLEHIKKNILALFSKQKLATLSTAKDDKPYASLVAFVGDRNLKTILFATARTTRKFSNLASNLNVALLINNSRNDESDFHEAMAVTVTGTAEVLSETEKIRHMDRYLATHPYLADFVSQPTCALISVKASRYFLVENFQKVMILNMDKNNDS
ncbi:MAG: pyridoxamine 5'-phosphate oxidase family protein [Desulfobacterales bacterium]|nr:pyridoxamine 5'-phosphate oxidase family protein [Desulfobacterales bacterium]